MKVFQIEKSDVLLIDGNKQYTDTLTNFYADSGLKDLPERVWYDDSQRHCIVRKAGETDDTWQDYPNAEYDGYIAKIDDYIAAKAQREYVPPTVDELKAQAISEQYRQYVDKRDAIVYVDDLGFATDDAGQRDWQVALTLMGDSGQYKVYDKDGKTTKMTTVTHDQMIQAGNAARTQQLAAYSDLIAVRDKINDCKTADELKPYLPPEMAK